MSFNRHILNASRELTAFKAKIIELISKSEKMLTSQMNFASLTTDLVIKSGKFVVPEVGIGAYCVNQYEIQMTLDIDNPSLLNSFDESFMATLAHETHHACRESTIGFGNSLLDSMILEGLACHFEVELGYKTPVYVEHLTQESRQFFINKAKLEWLNDKYNHNDWFFGNQEKNIPKWIGYDLGYYLVGLYLQQTKQSAAECYDTPSATILDFLTDRSYVN